MSNDRRPARIRVIDRGGATRPPGRDANGAVPPPAPVPADTPTDTPSSLLPAVLFLAAAALSGGGGAWWLSHG